MKGSKEISPKLAAQRLGYALSYPYQLIWACKLEARKQGGRWLIPEAAVEARLKQKEGRIE